MATLMTRSFAILRLSRSITNSSVSNLILSTYFIIFFPSFELSKGSLPFGLTFLQLSYWWSLRRSHTLNAGAPFRHSKPYAFTAYAGACRSFPAFGLLIGVLAFERGLVSRFLSAGWSVILGEISYSIYLVHQILIRWYLLNRSMFASVPKTMLYIAYWIVVLSLSFIYGT
jgi:peptidoglycan/LPS O-acetylase OafA/YrhL